MAYLFSLTPEQRDKYEQIAGESILQAIQEAGEAAQAGSSSSVTITEVEDSQPGAPRLGAYK